MSKTLKTCSLVTLFTNYIALPLSAHIREGILHPPDLPKPREEDIPGEGSRPAGWRAESRPIAPPEADRTRFVLGNWHEETPHLHSFLGHLYGMRVLFLHKDEDHPEWPVIWADALWRRGRVRKLIEPLPLALGMKAWKLNGDLDAWGRLTSEGAREGWLPWRVTLPAESVEAEEAPMFALTR